MKTRVSNRVMFQRGMSLIELLIAMTLGLILLTGMIAVFSGNKSSSELNTAMANIQENARFALNTLSKDVRLSGYQGCLDPMQGSMIVKAAESPVWQTGFTTQGAPEHNFRLTSTTGAVVISEDQWLPAISGDFVPPVVNAAIPGTHVLSVQYGDQDDSTITGSIQIGGVPNANGPIVTSRNLNLEVGDLALISSCDNADLFKVSNVGAAGVGQLIQHAAPLNVDGSLSIDQYGEAGNILVTKVMKFKSMIYYIADTGLENESGDQVRALYQQSYPYNDDENPPSELVQGVENMRLSFGMDTGNGIQYVTADDPLFNPLQVVSVQIGLMLTSWDSIADQDDSNIYTIAGQAIRPSENSIDGLTHAQDRRYRLVFNTTIKVRNRRSSQ